MKTLAVLICCGCLTAGATEGLTSDQAKQLVDAIERRYQDRFEAQERWMREAIAAQEEKVKVALVAAEKATDKSERSANERFSSMNEFRGQLKDQAGTFISRQEALAYLAGLIGLVAWTQRKPAAPRDG